MESAPQLQPTDQTDTLLAKARQVAERIRMFADANAQLQDTVGTQLAELVELRGRIRDLEERRDEAKHRLRHLANQLPQE